VDTELDFKTGREEIKVTNLTKISMNRAILMMAIPATGSMLIESLYQVVDIFWIGKLGTVPVASSTAASFFLWFLFSLANIPAIAANTLVSQAVGSNALSRTALHVRNCVKISLIISFVLMSVCFVSYRIVAELLGLEPVVIDGIEDYITPWLLFLPVVMLMMPLISAIRGSGDAKTPLLISIGCVCLNLVLDPLLIFGFGFFPKLGLAGAAWASVICHLVGVVLAIMVLKKKTMWLIRPGSQSQFLEWRSVKRIFAIGLPISVNGIVFSGTYAGLTAIIAGFGTVSVAAIGIGTRIEFVPWYINYGFAIAAATLMGQYLGADQVDKAEQISWRSCQLALIANILFFVVIWTGSDFIIGFFTTDILVIRETSVYLKIISVCWLIGVFEVVLEGAYSGAGYTIPAMVVGVTLTLLRIPIAYFLAVKTEFEVISVWLAIGSTMVLKGAILGIWFKTGRWKQHVKLS